MATNVSVERFRALTKELKQEVFDDAVEELNAQADILVKTIESVAPRGKTGELVHSIKKVPGKKPTVVRVVAGSSRTVKGGYSYPRADEFGTVHMKARPFFFPTYRLMKRRMIGAMKRKLTATIKKRSAE